MSDAKVRTSTRPINVLAALVAGSGLLGVSAYWLSCAKEPASSLGPVEQALFPLPQGGVVSGLPGRVDTGLLLHTRSRLLLETDAEKGLEFIGFDPLATPRLVMKQGILSADIASRFQKKLRWWPHFEKRGLVEPSNIDTCAVRIVQGGYTFQLLENRACFVLYARHDAGHLNLAKSSVCEAVPQCYMDFIDPHLLEGAEVEVRLSDSATFGDGTTLHCFYLMLSTPLALADDGFADSISLCWRERTAVFSFEKQPSNEVATPSGIAERPIAVKRSQR